VRKELERVELPEAEAAGERAWRVVRAGFDAREPLPRERRRWPLVVVLAAAALAGALVTPPGQAVLDEIREVVGVEKAQPALFSLPSGGRLLVTSDAGVWVVQRDGSRRLVGSYREASWSPFGRFVVAARRNELAALEPDGDVRWTLARPGVRLPTWGGTQVDTRIAYLRGRSLRVVAGDGEGDRRRARNALPVAAAWRPGPAHVLAYVRGDGFVRVIDADRGTVLMKRPARGVIALDWVADRLLVVSRDNLVAYNDSGRPVLRRHGRFAAAALAPRAQALALVRSRGHSSTVEVLSRDGRARQVFAGAGQLADVAWSSDGRWLLVTWPAADQWLFVRADG
jgi:hypothetical protein